MREIKFRFWNVNKNKMVYGPTDNNPSPSWILAICESYEIEPMQFTGLKDRNGEDVWEGDIVHFSYGIPPIGVNAPIEFLNGSFYAITDGHKPSKAILGELNDYVGDFEIYGNVYENPELVGGTQKVEKEAK